MHTCFIVFLFQPGTAGDKGKDTLRIKSDGPRNHIQIDSAWFSRSPADTIIVTTTGTTGEINQTGENNRVEINTGGESPNNKRQITNSNQNSKNKKRTKPAIRRQADRQATCNEKPETCNVQRVTIKQSGNNNSVKINQR